MLYFCYICTLYSICHTNYISLNLLTKNTTQAKHLPAQKTDHHFKNYSFHFAAQKSPFRHPKS